FDPQYVILSFFFFFFFQAEDGIRDKLVTGVQTCALPISRASQRFGWRATSYATWSPPETLIKTLKPLQTVNIIPSAAADTFIGRSEEHTSELQSLAYLVCRLLLEKKNNINNILQLIELLR